MRPSGRELDQCRQVSLTLGYTKHAEGSVLVRFGDTHVLCNASVTDSVPRFLKGKGQGWVTAEYNMLPRSTHTRSDREAVKGKQSGRTLEIQRLIGRSLRASIDTKRLGESTIILDCDVLQADGGTRTAAITGACVALKLATQWMIKERKVSQDPFEKFIAAVSVGLYRNQPVLDLDYAEDVIADTDMNVVMTDDPAFIELQGTAEEGHFSKAQLDQLLTLAESGIVRLFALQRKALGEVEGDTSGKTVTITGDA